ncbi:MAG: alpha-amylase family glycosyl hydrolase [Anaerolineaceae bacterium]|nr:alpha-amylase family glycosyl hydrolase [Anaerolineaceae bacterium]
MTPTEFTTPEWVHHAVFYQIFPDRFASSPQVPKPGNLEPWDAPPSLYGFKGGDLLGIAERLDYLQDLGITAIYCTPVFQSASNHRYHTYDYFQVDPLLGGNPALSHLLDQAHRRGMRVVLDGVFNHASRGFWPFHHILETGAASPYLDWFKVHDFPLNAYSGAPNYDSWWNLPALPVLNVANPQVRDYIYQVARYWVEQGIDGWRLDVPFEIREPGFWPEFRRVVKQANPEAYLTGEIPNDGTPWLQGDQFDGVMNYLLAYGVWGFFGGPAVEPAAIGPWMTHAGGWMPADAPGFLQLAGDLLQRYPRPAVLAQLNLLDSHDTARFHTLLQGRRDLFRLATLFQMTYPGAPCIYYGNEIGLEGSHDPDNRRAFPWDESRWDHELRGYVQDCVRERHAHRALRDGEFLPLYAEGQRLLYARRSPRETLLVAINRAEQPWRPEAPLQELLPEGSGLRVALGPAGQARVFQGRLDGLTLPPFSGALLVEA